MDFPVPGLSISAFLKNNGHGSVCDTHLSDCAAVLLCPELSSLTGEMMSNWMGVSGATKASNESTDRAGDGSEPTELMLLALATRPLLKRRERWMDGVTGGGLVFSY